MAAVTHQKSFSCNGSGSTGRVPALESSVQCCSMQGALDWHPAPKPVLEAAKQSRAAAEAHGVDIGTLAFKESARLPGVAVHLIGMRTPEEVPVQALLQSA